MNYQSWRITMTLRPERQGRFSTKIEAFDPQGLAKPADEYKRDTFCAIAEAIAVFASSVFPTSKEFVVVVVRLEEQNSEARVYVEDDDGKLQNPKVAKASDTFNALVALLNDTCAWSSARVEESEVESSEERFEDAVDFQ